MSNYLNELDRIGLERLGIGFKTEEESLEFEWIIQEELMVRVGAEISSIMSKKQMAEYVRLYDPIVFFSWLAENCPNYQDVLAGVTNKLKMELLMYRNQIAGCMSTLKLEKNGVLVDEIDMDYETRNNLKKAGILTYGEMVGIGDLSSIDTLTLRNVLALEDLINFVHKMGIKSVLIE